MLSEFKQNWNRRPPGYSLPGRLGHIVRVHDVQNSKLCSPPLGHSSKNAFLTRKSWSSFRHEQTSHLSRKGCVGKPVAGPEEGLEPEAVGSGGPGTGGRGRATMAAVRGGSWSHRRVDQRLD